MNNRNRDPVLRRIHQDLVLFEHSDPVALAAGRSTNSYALLDDGRALLVDVALNTLLPLVREIAAAGHRPAGLSLSHHHVVSQGNGLAAIAAEFEIPILLHPLDVDARRSDVQFEHPVGHPVLASFGVEALHFPGHTDGHVMLYHRGSGGLLLAGDAGMSTTYAQAVEGVRRVVRPPADFNADDEQLRAGWAGFDRPVVTFAAYHGTVFAEEPPEKMTELMAPLRRTTATSSMAG